MALRRVKRRQRSNLRQLHRSASPFSTLARHPAIAASALALWLLGAAPTLGQSAPSASAAPPPVVGGSVQPVAAGRDPGESVGPPAPATAIAGDAEAPAEGSDTRSQLPPPPWSLILQWLPLKPQPSATLQRRELRAIAQDLERGRPEAACQAAAALLDARQLEASRLFYAPIRKDADLAGIERFLDAFVRGPDPMLVVAGEQWAPAPSWRDTAAVACARAAKPAIAERFLRASAGLQLGGRSAVAVALLRWRRGGGLAAHAWWLSPTAPGPSGAGGAPAAEEAAAGSLEGRLLAAILLPDDPRRRTLARLRADADPTQRPLVDAVTVWRSAQASPGPTP